MAFIKLHNKKQLPSYFEDKRIDEMQIGDVGYVAYWALVLVIKEDDLEWYLKPFHTVQSTFGGTTTMKVKRTSKGYEVTLPQNDGWGQPFTRNPWSEESEVDFEWFPATVFQEKKV
jgi:hypothetical protein